MKKVMLCAASLMVMPVTAIAAMDYPDPYEVGPNVYERKAFENERVRVNEIHFEPGEEIVMHSHPDHFLYVLQPGTLLLSHPDGTTSEFKGEAGQVAWIPGESNAAKNTGQTDFKALVVELKN